MKDQLTAYELKMAEAEAITGIKKAKIEAYSKTIVEIDKIVSRPGKRIFFKILLGIKDIHKLELQIKKLEYTENLAVEEASLRVIEKYLSEDRVMYDAMQKRREKYIKEIEEGKFELAMEAVRMKVGRIVTKNKEANVIRLQGLLEMATKAETLEEQIDCYEALVANM